MGKGFFTRLYLFVIICGSSLYVYRPNGNVDVVAISEDHPPGKSKCVCLPNLALHIVKFSWFKQDLSKNIPVLSDFLPSLSLHADLVKLGQNNWKNWGNQIFDGSPLYGESNKAVMYDRLLDHSVTV